MTFLQRIKDWLSGQPKRFRGYTEADVESYKAKRSAPSWHGKVIELTRAESLAMRDGSALNLDGTRIAEGVIRRMGTNNLDLWLAQLNRTRRAEIQFAEAEDIERRPRAEVRRLVISEIERRKQTAQQ
jgi:hypothetical protein